jgi:hypothetical protein
MSRSKSVAATPSTAAPAGCGSALPLQKPPLLSAFRQLRQLRQGYLMGCKWWSPVPQAGIFIQGVCSRPRRPCRPCRFPTLSIGLERQAGSGHRFQAAVTCALLRTQPPTLNGAPIPAPRPRPSCNKPPATPAAPMNIGRAAGVSHGGTCPSHHCTLSRLACFLARPLKLLVTGLIWGPAKLNG